MKKLRVGIIGFGFIGPHHLDAIRRLGFAEVTAIATTSAKSAREKAERHHVEKSYGDWRELVADPEIDVIDIAAPTDLHAPAALAAIAAGRHVIVDKPMALTSAEAKRMLAARKTAAGAIIEPRRGRRRYFEVRTTFVLGFGDLHALRGAQKHGH